MEANTFMSLLSFVLVVLMLVGPFILGGYLAKMLRMPDYGWKISLILFTVIVSLSMSVLKWPPKFGIDLKGGVILIYEIDKEQLKQEKKDLASVNMDKLVGAINLRVNPGGQKEVTIRPYGADEIEITIPNVNDAELNRIKEIISQTGKLEFRIVANIYKHKDIIEMAKSDPNKTVYYQGKDWVARWVKAREGERFSPQANAVRQRKVGDKEWTEVLVVNDPYNVTGDYLANSRAGNEYGKPIVLFSFNTTGGQLFGRLTADNRPNEMQPDLKNQLAIILDNILYSAPNILTTISDNGQISGNFTPEEVNKIVEVLNAGSLPAALAKTPVQELKCSAQLGSDTIQKATIAMILSALLVIAFMVFYYRFSGILAVIALAINILGIVAVMITFNAAFTLTGFAALALTVGMAVDNNVLVYERMREELAKGAAIRMAIRNAFNRVGTTIIDCNMTHVIVAIVLWTMGSEQIKGFAITLLLGVAFSMFTAVFVSHVFFDIAERHHWITKLKMMHVIGHTSIDFMRIFPACLTFSIVITILGLGAAFYRGVGLFDIDFTGGVSVQVQFDKPHTAEEVREKLTDDTEMPDLAVNEVRVGDEGFGLRFDVNTSRGAAGKDKGEAQDLVKKFIQKQFPTELKKNDLTVKDLGPAIPRQATNKPPVKDETKLKLPEPAEKDKKATPAGEKSTPAKQSSYKRRSTNWLALVAAAPLFFAQVDALPAQPPADAPVAEKAVDNKTPETKKETAKPADTKPADTKAAVPPVDELSAPTEVSDPFKGGSQAELNFKEKIDHSKVQDIVTTALKDAKFSPENVQIEITGAGFSEGDPDTARLALDKWNIKLTLTPEDASKVFDAAKTKLAAEPFFPTSNSIGSAVAGSTRLQALWALIASWALIILYLWIRFQGVAFGLAAVIALIHDVLVMLGGLAFSYWLAKVPGVSDFLLIDQFKINLPIIAAFLTIIGYSVNDTIVVFDRIREIRGKDPYLTRKMVNDATNQTLSRTIITSLTVFMVVVVLYWAGGPALRGFSFALTIGVLTGTYSSIYVAAPILLWLVGKHKVTADHPHYEAKP
jgi:SecD/SecF fusion protein